MKKSILAFCLLVVCAFVLCAASLSFSLSSPATAGGVELKAGDYQVKVQGEEISLQPASGKPIKVNAKIETLEKKSRTETSIEADRKDGKMVINSITFGHSKSKIVFAK